MVNVTKLFELILTVIYEPCTNVALMLAQRLRRWVNIKATLGERIVFAEYSRLWTMAAIPTIQMK